MELKRANGATYDIVGYHFEERAEGAPTFAGGDVSLPAKVDLRPGLSPVEAQGSTQSCVAQAAAGAYEYLLRRHRGSAAYDVSRLFIYYNARAASGATLSASTLADTGASLQKMIRGLQEHGACAEGSWPFEEGRLNERPPDGVYEEARQFVIEGAEYLRTDLQFWKQALASGHPILFALKIHPSFDKHAKLGLIPMPTEAEREAERRGEWSGHAMLCVGYSDAEQVFIVRNSWGPDWGDGGYCYVPYRYMMSRSNRDDSWIVKHVHRLEPDPSTWHDDGVLDPVDTVLSKMSEEAYAAMLDAMGEHRFEVRLALLFLRSAAADGAIVESECARMAASLRPVLARMGGHDDAHGILLHALGFMNDEALLEGSITLFARFLSTKDLAAVLGEMREVAGADWQLHEREKAFLTRVARHWWVEGEARE